jgi:hypothetical protein
MYGQAGIPPEWSLLRNFSLRVGSSLVCKYSSLWLCCMLATEIKKIVHVHTVFSIHELLYRVENGLWIEADGNWVRRDDNVIK